MAAQSSPATSQPHDSTDMSRREWIDRLRTAAVAAPVVAVVALTQSAAAGY
jgi:negative regulator of sigma E activity